MRPGRFEIPVTRKNRALMDTPGVSPTARGSRVGFYVYSNGRVIVPYFSCFGKPGRFYDTGYKRIPFDPGDHFIGAISEDRIAAWTYLCKVALVSSIAWRVRTHSTRSARMLTTHVVETTTIILQNAKLSLLSGCGHAPREELPGAMLTLIREFLPLGHDISLC